MLLAYIFLCIIVFGCTGFILEDVDGLEDVEVKHVILGVVFFPATIAVFVIFCVYVGIMVTKEFFEDKRMFGWLNKPVFKKKQKKISE